MSSSISSFASVIMAEKGVRVDGWVDVFQSVLYALNTTTRYSDDTTRHAHSQNYTRRGPLSSFLGWSVQEDINYVTRAEIGCGDGCRGKDAGQLAIGVHCDVIMKELLWQVRMLRN